MTSYRRHTHAVRRPPHRQGDTARPSGAAAPEAAVEAVRFTVTGPMELRATHGVLLADEVHRLVVRELDGGRAEVVGHAGASSNHTHAHWVPLPTGAVVTSLLLWVPVGLSTAEVNGVLSVALRGIAGHRCGWPVAHEVNGRSRLRLRLQSAGPVETAAPELCGPARVWHSLTPYLPVRHRKRAETLADHLAQDVGRELAYRDRPPAIVRRLGPEGDPWATAFRRHRAKEHCPRHRPGYGLRLEFDEPRPGPLLLGQLSHFGFGIFVPESGDE